MVLADTMLMPDIQEIEVTSLGEFLDSATPTVRDPQSGRLRDDSVYRGVTHVDWPLLTSLDRLGGITPAHSKVALERHIFRNFQRYSRPYLTQQMGSDWELLVTAQHYGLPTRLLDWSYSPLVAMHFATLDEHEGGDRVVWRLDWKLVHEHFHLDELAFLAQDLDNVLQEHGIDNLWQFFEHDSHDKAFVCMLEPPALDARIVTQSATFTLSSDKTQSLDNILRQHNLSAALTRFVVPQSRIHHVRDQLDMCGLDERRLFPDLGGVADQMRRYYAASLKSAMLYS